MANFIDGKFRKNYQVPYSLLMGLNCALGSNRRQGEEKHPKKWGKLSLIQLFNWRWFSVKVSGCFWGVYSILVPFKMFVPFFLLPRCDGQGSWHLPIIVNISKVSRVCIWEVFNCICQKKLFESHEFCKSCKKIGKLKGKEIFLSFSLAGKNTKLIEQCLTTVLGEFRRWLTEYNKVLK